MAWTESAIINGPSKWDLMLSLFDSKTGHEHEVQFQLEVGVTMHVFLSSVEREDGSAESWNFQGWSTGYSTARVMWKQHQHVRGYFNTLRRKGHFRLVSK
ncbi:MAG: hypothetical protein HY092_03090 [Candidatus Kerfeldbacteria bacterium]|nr:hypothetical protein [Candidatus Kerfeldbacteria bacterium]